LLSFHSVWKRGERTPPQTCNPRAKWRLWAPKAARISAVWISPQRRLPLGCLQKIKAPSAKGPKHASAARFPLGVSALHEEGPLLLMAGLAMAIPTAAWHPPSRECCGPTWSVLLFCGAGFLCPALDRSVGTVPRHGGSPVFSLDRVYGSNNKELVKQHHSFDTRAALFSVGSCSLGVGRRHFYTKQKPKLFKSN
jgi:hypothetical protein